MSAEERASTSGRDTIPAPTGGLARQRSWGGSTASMTRAYSGGSPPGPALPMHPGEGAVHEVEKPVLESVTWP